MYSRTEPYVSWIGSTASIASDVALTATDGYYTNQYMQGGNIDRMLAQSNLQAGDQFAGQQHVPNNTPPQVSNATSWISVACVSCAAVMMVMMMVLLLV